MNIKLSILIPSIVERNTLFLSRLLKIIEPQIQGKPVELIIYSDNAKISIGKKRNKMIEMANGEYVCFVDDDDRVSDDYVESILKVLEDSSPDVVVFDSVYSMNGFRNKLTKFGIEYSFGETPEYYSRYPNHLMVHRKSNITEVFQDIRFGEDDEWAKRMLPRIKTQSRIDKVLYFYDFNTFTKKYL